MDSESLLMACKRNKMSEADIWYMDTDCSNHMSGCKESFTTVNESYNSTVTFGDNSSMEERETSRLMRGTNSWKQFQMSYMYLH